MELSIKQNCPTCGASITLQEDDRVIQCSFCDVRNYMVQSKLPRFALPAKLPKHIDHEQLIYVPYLRFKGSIYYCQGNEVKHTIIDTTRVGVDSSRLPVSLGLRPQAMKILPVTENLHGTYIRQNIKTKSVFQHAARLTTLFKKKTKNPILHRAFIGETVSRVYLPLYIFHDILYDGITHENLGSSHRFDTTFNKTVPFHSSWEPQFLSTLCPGCGEPMVGSKDTLVMSCNNCESLWQETGGRFSRLVWSRARAGHPDSVYIPFWRITPAITGVELESLGDFLRMTNQPVVVRREHTERKLTFLIPAFKVNPGVFLQTAKNLTISQLNIPPGEPGKIEIRYPVTLPHKEAVQSLKSVLAACAVSPQKVMPHLANLSFSVDTQEVVYLPFTDIGHDLVQEQTKVNIMAAALRYGRSL